MRSYRRRFTHEQLKREMILFAVRTFFWSLAWRFTGPRYFPDIKWSDACYTHNVFRFWEWLVGRRFGIRCEVMASWVKGITTYRFYTWEARFAHLEGLARRVMPRIEAERLLLPRIAEVFALVATIGNSNIMVPISILGTSFVTSGTQQTASATPTISLTVSGSDTIMMFMPDVGSGGDVITTPEWNGSTTGVTLITKQAGNGTGFLGMYYLDDPASGTHNAIGHVSSGTDSRMNAGVYSGTNGIDTSNKANTNNTATLTATITAGVANAMLVLQVQNNTGDASSSTDGNVRQHNGNGRSYGDKQLSASGANSMDITGTGFGATNDWWWIAATIIPVAVGPTNVKTWDGLALASVKTIDGLAIGSIKTINGIT